MRKISLSVLASTIGAVLALPALPGVLASAESADEGPTYGPKHVELAFDVAEDEIGPRH